MGTVVQECLSVLAFVEAGTQASQCEKPSFSS